MRQLSFTLLTALGLAACLAVSHAADCACGQQHCNTCTDQAERQPCEPACKSSWDEAKTKKPVIGASPTEESKPAKDMFGDEDPFMKRKREQAELAAAAVTASVMKAVDGGAAALAAAAPAENTLSM